MKNVLISVVLLVSGFISPFAFAEFDEGIEYERISAAGPLASDEQVEVVEFFWFGCPHCYHFEPYLDNWLKTQKPEDVKFKRVPAVFKDKSGKPSAKMVLHAKMYYALDLMGEADRMMPLVFHEMQENRNKMDSIDAITDFLSSKDVNMETFDKAFKSFALNTRLRQESKLMDKYGLNGVPAMVVSGQYRSGSVKNYQQLVDVTSYMVEQVKKDQSAK